MRRLVAVLALLLLGIVLAGTAFVWVGWERLHEPREIAEPVTVEIPRGSTAADILALLDRAELLAEPRIARLYLLWLGDPALQAGTYRFEPPVSTAEAIDAIRRGDVYERPVTIVEGWTMREIADHLTAEGFGDRHEFVAAMRDPSPIRDIAPAATDLEGYLFPDSYRFAPNLDEEEIVLTLVETFRRRFASEVAPESRGGFDRTAHEIVTLASIVEKEARLAEERPLIAGVYANRLERGIGLYADPTIIYALKQRGTWDGDLRSEDLELESPYNTYLHPGLPPGPICSPGLASLEAAARPEEVPYLYFVSRNDGSHVFAETLAEHNENVERWQRRYWRDRR